MAQNYYTRKLQPYIDPRNNEIDFHACMASILILFGGMFFIDQAVQTNDEIQTALFFMILFYNAYFLLKWTMRFLVCLLRIHSAKLKRIVFLREWVGDMADYEEDLKVVLARSGTGRDIDNP